MVLQQQKKPANNNAGKGKLPFRQEGGTILDPLDAVSWGLPPKKRSASMDSCELLRGGLITYEVRTA